MVDCFKPYNLELNSEVQAINEEAPEICKALSETIKLDNKASMSSLWKIILISELLHKVYDGRGREGVRELNEKSKDDIIKWLKGAVDDYSIMER